MCVLRLRVCMSCFCWGLVILMCYTAMERIANVKSYAKSIRVSKLEL